MKSFNQNTYVECCGLWCVKNVNFAIIYKRFFFFLSIQESNFVAVFWELFKLFTTLFQLFLLTNSSIICLSAGLFYKLNWFVLLLCSITQFFWKYDSSHLSVCNYLFFLCQQRPACVDMEISYDLEKLYHFSNFPYLLLTKTNL